MDNGQLVALDAQLCDIFTGLTDDLQLSFSSGDAVSAL
jgi:hypothetical protein